MSSSSNPFPNIKGLPTLDDVATLIKEGKVKNLCILAGAGISTSAGIPDFRSPKTGLYSNLEKYKLPYPEAIFDIDYFVRKPEAFFALAKEIYPGNFHPTLTHFFFTLLRDKGILKAVFTQNIDTLERVAGLDDDSVIEAHGSFASAECLACKTAYTKEEIKPTIELGEVVHCTRASCKGNKRALVKPLITFFGEGLPERFFQRLPDLAKCDLLLVLGTSLTVQPVASLINRVPRSCPRVLINLESVGEARKGGEGFDFKKGGTRDVRRLGSCDDGCTELAEKCGWGKDLKTLVEREKKKWDAKHDKTVAETLEEIQAEGDIKVPAESSGDVDALTNKVGEVNLDDIKPVAPEGEKLKAGL